MSLVASASHIRSAFERILLPKQVVELRALHVPTDRGPRTLSGFFDDHDALAKAAAELSDMGAGGVYFTPNPIKPDLLGSNPNRVEVATRGSLTRDVDILGARWLLIDVDPEREAGKSATSEEKLQAAVLLRMIRDYLLREGWPTPLFGDSGNGYHLMYLVEDLEVEQAKAILASLAFLFDTDQAKVDQKVYNPSRIWKVYGTVARKGPDTEDRPHRRTEMLTSTGGTSPVSPTFLHKVADLLPKTGEKTKNTATGALDTYIEDNFPQARGPETWHNNGRRWVFDVCPWDAAHTDRSAYILQFSDGGVAAGCLHANCEGAKKNKKGAPQGWKLLQKKAGTPFSGSGGSSGPNLGPIAPSSANSPNLTDLGNAKRMVQAFQHELAFCAAHGAWHIFNGRRWLRDEDGAIHRRAKAAVAGIFVEAAAETDPQRQQRLHKHALKSESHRALNAVVRLAETEQGVAVTSARLDSDPWLFNVKNGTIDLRTGNLQMHDRTDYITKISPIEWDSTAECPTWDAFLDYAMKGDPQVIDFIHRFFGYCLTGLSTEQVLLFMEGTGQNGKTTALLILMYIMGDYAIQGAPGLLMAKKGESHPTEVADLEGVRFVANAEVEKGKPFAEVLIKQLTGSDRIRARRMRQDFYEFDPTHKLIIAANHRPIIKGNDEGIWRRVLRLPWVRKIEDKDPMFLDKLKAEAPGILRKLVEGCLKWQHDGLRPPPTVRMATQEYREEMDVLAEFLEDCCVIEAKQFVQKKALYLAYTDWCEGFRQRPTGYSLFCRQLSERGYTSQPRYVKVGNIKKSVRVWIGIGLRVDAGASVPRSETSVWN